MAAKCKIWRWESGLMRTQEARSRHFRRSSLKNHRNDHIKGSFMPHLKKKKKHKLIKRCVHQGEPSNLRPAFLQNRCLEFITIFPPKVVHILRPFLFRLEWWAALLDSAPHGFAWYCNILSLLYNCNRNTDVCRFSDVLTSRGSRGVSRGGRVPTRNQRLHVRQSVRAL